MHPLQLFSRCFLGLAVALAGGCGRENSHGLTLAPVKGVVSYQGRPLADAQVAFLPETPGQLPAMGMTDAEGRYELLTIVPGDGASLGKHRVTVTARQMSGAAAGGQAGTIVPGAADAAAPRIPVKYFSFETSGLTAEVKAEGTTANFELTDK